MTEAELAKLIREVGISRDQILREEAEMIFLYALSEDQLSAKLIFYGGTALRLMYGSPRFSEDIDLLATRALPFDAVRTFIERAVKSNPAWTLKDIKSKRQTDFALIGIRDEKLKHPFSLKIEIHKPAKKAKIETNLMLVKSPASILQPLLLVPTLSALKKLKEDALADRKKARDIFDLWYIASALREPFAPPKNVPRYSKRAFINELQVFLPRIYYPLITQLYADTHQKNSRNS